MGRPRKNEVKTKAKAKTKEKVKSKKEKDLDFNLDIDIEDENEEFDLMDMIEEKTTKKRGRKPKNAVQLAEMTEDELFEITKSLETQEIKKKKIENKIEKIVSEIQSSKDKNSIPESFVLDKFDKFDLDDDELAEILEEIKIKCDIESFAEEEESINEEIIIREMKGNDDSDSIRQYLKWIGEYPLLAKEEEKKLSIRIKIGKEAIDSLINNNSKILIYLADKYLDLGVPFMGSIDEAKNGFQKAGDRFPLSPDKEFAELALPLAIQAIQQKFKVKNIIEEDYKEILSKKINEKLILSKVKALDNEKKLKDMEEYDSVKEFLEEQKKIKKLSSEKELAPLIKDAQKAAKTLTQCNLRLVVSIAKKYMNRGMSFMDLIQEGNIGLQKTVEKFDGEKNLKFSTYATWWIRQSITRAIADQARIVRVPVHMVETINKQSKIQRQLTQELGRDPSNEEIAEKLGCDVKKVEDVFKIAIDPVSLETPVGEEDDSKLGDFIADSDSETPEQIADKEKLKEALRKLMREHLQPREERVLSLRYGLDDGVVRTLEEVGREFDVTRERIRQIEVKAIKKLQKYKEYLNDFVDE